MQEYALKGMLFCMRTTLDLEDDLMIRAKHLAVEKRTTLTALMEAALRDLLEREREDQEYDLPTVGGELPPGFPIHGSLSKMETFLESLDDPT